MPVEIFPPPPPHSALGVAALPALAPLEDKVRGGKGKYNRSPLYSSGQSFPYTPFEGRAIRMVCPSSNTKWVNNWTFEVRWVIYWTFDFAGIGVAGLPCKGLPAKLINTLPRIAY